MKQPNHLSESDLSQLEPQLDPAYADQFRRPTEQDSPVQEFTHALIRNVATYSGPVLSNREYVKIVLGAINEGTISQRMACLITMSIELPLSDELTPVRPHLLNHYRPLLLMLAENPLAITPLTCAVMRAYLAGKIIGVPVPEIGHAGAQTSYRVITANIETAFDHAALLLMSDFGRDLHLCKRPDCGNLFLVERGVKTSPRKYCGDNCRDRLLNRETGKHRVNASRAGLTTGEWLALLKERGPGFTPSQYDAEQNPPKKRRSKK